LERVETLWEKWRGKKDIRKNEFLAAACFLLGFSLRGQTFAANQVWQKVPKPHVFSVSVVLLRRNERLPMKVALRRNAGGNFCVANLY